MDPIVWSNETVGALSRTTEGPDEECSIEWHGSINWRPEMNMGFSRLLLAILMLGFSARAFAQGGLGQVPDPISSQELSTILNRHAKPTFDQWIAIDEHVERYADSFQELRDGPIQKLLLNARALSGGAPNAKVVEGYMRELDKVETRIRTLDNQLFDSILTLLREDQYVGLERARSARNRTRLKTGGAGQMGGSGSLDLWDTIATLQLEDDALAAIDLEMKRYEERLTRRLAELKKASSSMLLLIVERLEEAGYADIDMTDPANMTPEIMQALMQVVQGAYAESSERSGGASAKLRELNGKWVVTIGNLLPPLERRKFKTSFAQTGMMYLNWMPGATSVSRPHYQRVDDVIRFVLDGSMQEEFGEMVSSDMIDGVRALVDTFVQEENKQLDRLCAEAAQIDQMAMQLEMSQAAWGNEDEGDQDDQDVETPATRIQAIIERQAKAEQELAEALDALVASVESGPFAETFLASNGPSTHLKSLELNDDPTLSSESEAYQFVAQRASIPTAMGVGELARLREVVQEEAWFNAVLESMHEDYLAEYKRVIEPLIKSEQDAMRAIYSWNHETSKTKYDTNAMDDAYSFRHEGVEAMRALDAKFFLQLEGAVPAEVMPALRLFQAERSLERSLSGAEAAMRGAMFGQTEPANALYVLSTMELSDEEAKKLAEKILAATYELVTASESLQLAQSEANAKIARMNFEMQEGIEGGGQSQSVSIYMAQEAERQAIQRAVAPLEVSRDEKQTEVFSQIKASLQDDTFAAFEAAWRMARHPMIFNDTSTVPAAFSSSLELSNLGIEERARITALSAQYEARWTQTGNEMADATEIAPDLQLAQMDQASQQQFLDAMEKRQRAQFERTELQASMLRKLARVLTAEQRKQVPAIRAIAKEIGDEANEPD